MNTAEQNRQFIQRMKTWWETHSLGTTPVAAGELAPGIICVADLHLKQGQSVREVDIFFDLERYRFRQEKVWAGSQLKGLGDAKLGYLPGIGCVPRLRTPGQAHQAASKHIAPQSGEEIVWTDFRLAEEFEQKLLSEGN